MIPTTRKNKIEIEGSIAGIKALKEGLTIKDTYQFNPYTTKQYEYQPWLTGWKWVFKDEKR